MKKHAIWVGVLIAVVTLMSAYDLFARSATFNPTVFTDVKTTGDFVATGSGAFRNVSATGLYGAVTGNVTGSSSLNLLLTGGTMTGPIKQRAAMGADAFKNVSSSGFYGPLTGNVTGTASLDLPLSGGTMTGAIKQRTAQPANAMKNISTTNGYVAGVLDVVGKTTLRNHTTFAYGTDGGRFAFTIISTSVGPVLHGVRQ